MRYSLKELYIAAHVSRQLINGSELESRQDSVLPSLSADQFATSVLTQSQLRVIHHLAFHKGCQNFAIQGQCGVGRARILVLHESKRCVS